MVFAHGTKSTCNPPLTCDPGVNRAPACIAHQSIPWICADRLLANEYSGAPNVSDRFAATLWALDFLPELSKANVVGVNFHGGPVAVYSPVTYSPEGQLTFVSPLCNSTSDLCLWFLGML